MSFDLSLAFILSGKPKRVMQLLTDPKLIRKWSGEDAVLEPVEGGRFEMFDGWVKGTVLKVSANELAYTWKPADWSEETKETEVHYLLEEDAAGTKVSIRHTGFPNEDEMKSHKAGWTDFFFDPLEDFILIIDKS
ncbi:MAG: SRPBCC domain-containing protein [Bacteroidota bacterium]